jgi:pimeloyl-ACP methyl ester carboxylesterase
LSLARPASAQLPVRYFNAYDGERLAYREMGEGRPVVLIHGYFSTALVNWVRYGHAATIATRGRRVLMPDVLVDDGFAFIEHLKLTDYDLGGYSLGARTTLRMLIRGAAPGRAVVAGMGLEGIVHTGGRAEYFRRVLTNPGTFQRGSLEWMTEAFLKTVAGDPQALLHILGTFLDTPREALANISTPILVATGVDDGDNGSGEALAAALANAQYRVLPGNHMSAVVKPELGAAIAEFLDAPAGGLLP